MGDNERKMLSNKKLKASLPMLRAIQDELHKRPPQNIEARLNSGREAGPSPCEAWSSSSSRGGPSSRSKGRGRR